MPPLHSNNARHDVSTISEFFGVHRRYWDLDWLVVFRHPTLYFGCKYDLITLFMFQCQFTYDLSHDFLWSSWDILRSFHAPDKLILTQYRNPIIKIRHSHDYLIFVIGIPLPGKNFFILQLLLRRGSDFFFFFLMIWLNMGNIFCFCS